MTRLIVWRHGNTDWNAVDRVQGQSDALLNTRGREQAAAAAAKLTAVRPAAIVSSDLSRAADTAGALAALTELPVSYDSRLRERYYGAWQGMTLSEVAAAYPTEYAAWRSGDPAPGCEIETLDDLGKRVSSALQDLADAHPGATVVAVSHGGAARQGCGHLLGWPHQVLRTVRGLANCHWTELAHDDVRGWQLRSYNVGA
jgi:glucosyl-3-phosphoglycerate phosphatase